MALKIDIRKAERTKSKLRLAIAGPSGSGKTMGSLKLAQGLGGKVCLIDTERGSGDLYADLYEYSVITLEPPFKPDLLIEAIHAAEAAGFDVIIVDSLSHFWADEGGLLDQADKMQSAGKNRFTLWADITPQHRRLVNTLLNSPKHIIATMRSKQEYAMETDEKTGKASVRKLGLAPVQREGMEYEFTIFFDVDQQHNAKASKDRTSMFGNEIFLLDASTGKRILEWLNTGKVNARGMKTEIISALKDRLEIPLPSKEDLPAFIKGAVKKLTGIELSEDPAVLEKAVAALALITDKAEAQRIAWSSDAPKAPEAPPQAPTASEGPKTTETPSPAPSAPQASVEPAKAAPVAPAPVEEEGIKYPTEDIDPADIPF